MRVFQGVTGQAGQPIAIAKGLRALGIDAKAGSIQPHKFGYSSDFQINLEKSDKLESVFATAVSLSDRFDVFHFHARSLASEWPQQGYPSLLDLLVLKERDKKIFFHFRGQEIRSASEFSRLSPYHYVDHPESGKLFRRMPDDAKAASLRFVRAVADGIFVTDPELQTYVPEARIVPRVLDEADWQVPATAGGPRPLVVHAPSRRGVKGTDSVLQAVQSLQRSLEFDFQLVEGLPHEEARRVYERADVVVDQLRIGWYGVLATEAMALGKPTIAYIREDLWQAHGQALPIVNANPDNIAQILEFLIKDADARSHYGMLAREYFMRVHSTEAVCRDLVDLYRTTPLRKIDWEQVGVFMDRQRQVDAAAAWRRFKKGHSSLNTGGRAWSRLRTLWAVFREEGMVSAAKLLGSKFRMGKIF